MLQSINHVDRQICRVDPDRTYRPFLSPCIPHKGRSPPSDSPTFLKERALESLKRIPLQVVYACHLDFEPVKLIVPQVFLCHRRALNVHTETVDDTVVSVGVDIVQEGIRGCVIGEVFLQDLVSAKGPIGSKRLTT